MNLVSVIMPAYNCESYITNAIESILSQTHSNIELLIADDGSTDNTKEIISRFNDNRIKIFHNDKNLGYLKTTNRLFEEAKGDYITFQDADDWSEKDRLDKQLKAFSSDPDLGICGSWATLVTENGDYFDDVIRDTDSISIRTSIESGNQFLGATIMIKREVYEAIGGYRPFFNKMGFQDYDWAYLICEKYKGINLPEKLYAYRQHKTSNSKKINLRRHISLDIAIFLGQQRKNNQGKDGLSEITTLKDELNEFILNLETPYLRDKSKIFREKASSFMYSKLYDDAIEASKNAIKSNPYLLANYRTLFYCLRKTLISK